MMLPGLVTNKDGIVSKIASVTTKPKITVMIVDDYAQVRQGLRLCLEQVMDDLEIVGEAADGLQAVQLAERLKPDVVLMDLEMPVMNGLEATRQIKDRHLAKGVIIVTCSIHSSAREQAMEVGADAFVEKATAARMLIPAIRDVFGESCIGESRQRGSYV
jgi:DNA-binding NarL/FixJ family response regulator